jgi:hypothetical protein
MYVVLPLATKERKREKRAWAILTRADSRRSVTKTIDLNTHYRPDILLLLLTSLHRKRQLIAVKRLFVCTFYIYYVADIMAMERSILLGALRQLKKCTI